MDRSSLEAEVVDPLIGTMVGRFRVERKIGQGGMGSVYELLQPAIHKRMALKLLHEEYAGRKEIVQRFFDEARAVNLIGHPSIVDISDFSHLADGRPFIIMEYLQGESLQEYLRVQGPLAEKDVVEILSQIASALSAAHAADIVHRDLKPENVFLVRRPGHAMQVKLLDFGIAKLKDKKGSVDATDTKTGVVLGTPTYMSPEQAQGNTAQADHRTDVYSLGVMLHEMLSGSPPFIGDTLATLIYKHIRAQPPNLSETRSDIAPQWARIVARAMAKAPEDRYLSMQALLDDVLSIDLARPASPQAAKRSAAPALLAVALIAGVAGWWLLRTPSEKAMTRVAAAPLASPPPLLLASIPIDAAPQIEESLDAAVVVQVEATPADAGPSVTDKGSSSSSKARNSGTLSVSATPWAQVYLDGKRIGQTPLRQAIPAGTHKVRLRNETTGASKTHRFRVKKGGTHTIRERW